MNEIEILKVFYDTMISQGITREAVFLSINEGFLEKLTALTGQQVSLEEAQALTDICIANEWLERTTIDPNYNFLSLTAMGLSVVLNYIY